MTSNNASERTAGRRGRVVLATNCVLGGAEWRRAWPLNKSLMRSATRGGAFAMKLMPIAVAVLVGVLTAFACVPLLGISSAIAGPAHYFPWAKAHGVLEPALFLWEVVVIGGIGVGAPALVSLVVLVRTFTYARVTLVGAFAAALLCGLYVAVPMAYFETPQLPLNQPWWAFGKEMALALVAIGVAANVRHHA
jgi:hypothetical protein